MGAALSKDLSWQVPKLGMDLREGAGRRPIRRLPW